MAGYAAKQEHAEQCPLRMYVPAKVQLNDFSRLRSLQFWAENYPHCIHHCSVALLPTHVVASQLHVAPVCVASAGVGHADVTAASPIHYVLHRHGAPAPTRRRRRHTHSRGVARRDFIYPCSAVFWGRFWGRRGICVRGTSPAARKQQRHVPPHTRSL